MFFKIVENHIAASKLRCMYIGEKNFRKSVKFENALSYV